MNKIRLSRSDVGDQELALIAQTIEQGYLGMGAQVLSFESQLASFLQTSNHVIAVSSGTAALHLALQAVGVTIGDEVLVPSITYLATYQAVSACGAVPVSCDVLSDTLFLDPLDAERRITSKTKAVIPVHYASSNTGVERIYDLASTYGLHVIEDAAHSFGSNTQLRLISSTERIICFSFDGIKNITSGEGGAVVTSSAEVASLIRDARLLGVHGDSSRRYNNSRSWIPDVTKQGWRYHMSNVHAAIGIAQLKNCAFRFERRATLAAAYLSHLSTINAIRTLQLPYHSIVPHIFPVLLDPDIRDEVRAFLADAAIETGIHYYPNHLLSKYRTVYSLPQAESAGSSLISLPLHPLLTDSQQDYVIQKLGEALDLFS
jgi:dTDP-4-amino-4,6-dideoxygalactose transaminase